MVVVGEVARGFILFSFRFIVFWIVLAWRRAVGLVERDLT
jgi:hypothetical protein